MVNRMSKTANIRALYSCQKITRLKRRESLRLNYLAYVSSFTCSASLSHVLNCKHCCSFNFLTSESSSDLCFRSFNSSITVRQCSMQSEKSGVISAPVALKSFSFARPMILWPSLNVCSVTSLTPVGYMNTFHR